MGWADLSGYGSDLHETPVIDQLAKENMRFTNAYAAAPICTPTRASIMTGKYPARLHMTTWFENSGTPKPNKDRKLLPPKTVGNLPLSEVTLAERFKKAGYYTVHVGKWHLGDSSIILKHRALILILVVPVGVLLSHIGILLKVM